MHDLPALPRPGILLACQRSGSAAARSAVRCNRLLGRVVDPRTKRGVSCLLLRYPKPWVIKVQSIHYLIVVVARCFLGRPAERVGVGTL